MKIVPDTNVLISATFWEGEANRIIKLVEDKKIACFLSKPIIDEYIRVLKSDEIIDKIEEKGLIERLSIVKLIQISKIVNPTRKIEIIENDPDDNKILECASEAKADYIITYDQKHLIPIKEFEGIKIILPKDFLSEFTF